MVADDRSCDQLGEHGNVQGKREQILLNDIAALVVGLLTVHVDHIGHALEGEERDADRQDDLPHGQGAVKKTDGDLCEEIKIFEINKQAKIEQHAGCQQSRSSLSVQFCLMNADPDEIVYKDRRHHQENILRFAPGVEEQAADQQHCVFPQNGRYRIIQNHRDRQKRRQKNQGAENHTLPS